MAVWEVWDCHSLYFFPKMEHSELAVETGFKGSPQGRHPLLFAPAPLSLPPFLFFAFFFFLLAQVLTP